jgi:dihydrofolate reductase
MRKVTLGLANSLDNYIARKDHGADWLHWSKEVAEISSKFLKTVDVILIGRKTYEAMLAFGHEMKRQIDLEFLDCKTLKGGYLVVTYRVKH